MNIILITGPVGSGKTLVAKTMVAMAPGPLAYIEGDTFWTFIASPRVEQPVAERFTMTIRAMIGAARAYAAANYDTIVDFSVPPWFLPAAKKMATIHGARLHFVPIMAPLAVCEARARDRTEGRITDYTPYKRLFNDFDGVAANAIVNDGPVEAAAQKAWAAFTADRYLC